MHILNILQCTNLGGTEHGALRLMQSLTGFGHTSEVVSMHSAGRFVPKLVDASIPVCSLDYRGKFGWRSHWAVRRAFSKVRADGIIMYGPTLSGILALGKVCAGRRILAVHFHHRGVKPEWAWRRLYSLVMRRFQFVTFCSDFIRREAEELYPPLAQVSRTVMNPMAVPTLVTPLERKVARDRLNLPADRPLVGNAGWLISRKRFDIFLEVAAYTSRKCPSVEFVIAGDGPDRLDLQRLAAQLGLEKRLHWLGWQSDLTDFYRAIDLLEFNSDWDAMGLTCLEAASHGVPVVASVLNGGLSEVLNDEAGCVLNSHSIQCLGEKCVALLTSPALAARAGLAARALVETRCAPEIVAGQYDELLQATRCDDKAG